MAQRTVTRVMPTECLQSFNSESFLANFMSKAPPLKGSTCNSPSAAQNSTLAELFRKRTCGLWLFTHSLMVFLPSRGCSFWEFFASTCPSSITMRSYRRFSFILQRRSVSVPSCNQVRSCLPSTCRLIPGPFLGGSPFWG